MKKFFTSDTFLIVYLVIVFCIVDAFAVSLYWQHQAVVHNAAFWEPNSWGVSSFKWNDVSFAQTPFKTK